MRRRSAPSGHFGLCLLVSRPLGPRGVKVGGGMWGSWAGRVREVKGEIPGVLVCGAGEREWVSELLACLGGGGGGGGL